MSSPNEIRKYLGYMRGKSKPNPHKENIKEENKNPSMRDLLKRMNSVNEAPNPKKTTNVDQKKEENKMSEFFDDNNVFINYGDLEVYDNGIFWSGIIDGQLEFVFSVTPEEKTSGVEVNYLDGFEPNDPENEEIIKKIEAYYQDFYKFWRDNELQAD